MQNNVIMQVVQSLTYTHINTTKSKQNSMHLVILQVHSSLIKMTYMREKFRLHKAFVNLYCEKYVKVLELIKVLSSLCSWHF